MTTQAIAIEGQIDRFQSRLEELVDRVIDALFGVDDGEVDVQPTTVARSIHDARRLKRDGDLDGALAVVSGIDTGHASVKEACWAYSEWQDLVRRRFVKKGVLLYSPGSGRAAALVSRGNGALEVVAVLGMRWLPGKVVSRCSLRGLKSLGKGGGLWS